MAISNPARGINYFFQGLLLLTKPKLRWFVIIPLIINISVFALLIHLFIDQMDIWIDMIIAKLPAWLYFLEWLIWTISVLLILVILFYGFSLLANIISAPFNGILSEQTERYLKGNVVEDPMTIMDMLKMFPRTILRELQKILYYIPRMLVVLVLSLLFPPAAPFLWFILGAIMMTIMYCDYPMDNHHIDFKNMCKSLNKKPLTSNGFGAIVMLATMIPVINFIVMPAAVCGATAYWVKELEAETKNNLHLEQ